VAFILSNIPIVVGLIVQTLKGYTQYNFGVYFMENVPAFISGLYTRWCCFVLPFTSL
jgi:hypothetical protein